MGLQDFTVYDMIARNANLFARREAWISDRNRVTFLDFYNHIQALAYSLELAD